jgi:hypothetical protein
MLPTGVSHSPIRGLKRSELHRRGSARIHKRRTVKWRIAAGASTVGQHAFGLLPPGSTNRGLIELYEDVDYGDSTYDHGERADSPKDSPHLQPSS